MNMKRLQQLAWMSSQRPPNTEEQYAPNKIPGHGLKWLSAELQSVENSFFEPAFDLETIRSIHLTCRDLSGLQKILTECKDLETIDLELHAYSDLSTDFNWSCITRHWENLTRLYITNLNIERHDQPWYIDVIGDVLEKCVNLIEIGIPIPYEFETDSIAQMSKSSSGGKEDGVSLRAVKSSLRFQWPKISNNLQFLYVTNLDISNCEHKFEFSVDEYWPIILGELLKVLKASIPATPSSLLEVPSVPLPRLQSIFARGSDDGSGRPYFGYRKFIPSEGYLIKEKEPKTEDPLQPSSSPNPLPPFFPSRNTDIDIKWRVEKIDTDDLKTKFPKFYGFRFSDQNNLWSDWNGKFWE
ncbi:hypothetical protein TWF281_009917 [Arthrobotrys megalospora]